MGVCFNPTPPNPVLGGGGSSGGGGSGPCSDVILVHADNTNCGGGGTSGGGGGGGTTSASNANTQPKTPCEAATDEANQALDNMNPTVGLTTEQQGMPTPDWLSISTGSYLFNALRTGATMTAGGFLLSVATGAILKTSYYFAKGVVTQGVAAGKVVAAQVKANLACQGSPIPLPNFGSPQGGD
jgi:hypothetical protein